MSDIKFACIHCGQRLSCNQAFAGQRLSCPACQRSILVPWAPAEYETLRTSGASTLEADLPAPSSPTELPRISIPHLSLPDIEASSVRQAPKVLQLQGRHRAAPGFSKLAVLSFALSLSGPLGFIPAIICGHVAKWQMRRNLALRGDSLATAGLAIAYASAVFTAVFAARTLLRGL